MGKQVPEKSAKMNKPKQAEEKDIAKEQAKVQVNADGSVTRVAQRDSNQSSAGEQMNLETFMKSMAKHDDLGSDDFSKFRSQQEWERLIVAMAGKIYSKAV